jgi:hypothetical protein
MARANHEIKDKESGMAQSSTSLSMPSISASRPCPYLGSRKNPGISFDRPSRGNICFGKERVKLKLFRRVNVPYTAISRSKQADLCLGSFSDCPIFIENSEKKSAGLDRPSQPRRIVQDPSGEKNRRSSKSRRKNKRFSARLAYSGLSRRWKMAVQVSAAFTLTVAIEFGFFLFMASNPSSYVEYLFMTIMRNDIKAFGMKHLGIKDKFGTSAGLVTGGNLRSLKNMSDSTKKRLKQSRAFQGLSRAERDRLRRQFRGK